MMNQPPLDMLRERVDSRYTLVVLAAKRARQLLEGADSLVECESEIPVTVALSEIADGHVGWKRESSGAD